MPQKLAILGPGLLGTSIALAAKRHGPVQVKMWARRPENVAEIQARNFADAVSTDLAATVAEADVVVLCVPIGAMPELARAIVEHVPAAALITDVGSVKQSVVTELSAIFAERGRFIGSHPMAGSHQTGHEAASAELFDGRTCVLTPDAATLPSARADATAFWQMLGAEVRTLSPAEHDEIVAWISHLPHLLAATLINTVSARSPAALEFHGPGFFDTTRVASGAPEMWNEIIRTNRAAVQTSAEAMIEKLRETITLLDRNLPMTDFLTHAKTVRDALGTATPNG